MWPAAVTAHLWRGEAQRGRHMRRAAQVGHLHGVVAGVPDDRRRAQRAVHDVPPMQACQGLHHHRQHRPLLHVVRRPAQEQSISYSLPSHLCSKHALMTVACQAADTFTKTSQSAWIFIEGLSWLGKRRCVHVGGLDLAYAEVEHARAGNPPGALHGPLGQTVVARVCDEAGGQVGGPRRSALVKGVQHLCTQPSNASGSADAMHTAHMHDAEPGCVMHVHDQVRM